MSLKEGEEVQIEQLAKKKTKHRDWLLLFSIACLAVIFSVLTSRGFAYGRSIITAAIADAFGGLLEYDLIALQGINTVSVRNLRVKDDSLTSNVSINDARIQFRPIALIRGENDRIIRKISFDSIRISLNESSITSVDVLLQQLSSLAEQFLSSRENSDTGGAFFTDYISANTITTSFLSPFGTWQFSIQDLLITLTKNERLVIDNTLLVELSKSGNTTLYGDLGLRLVGSKDMQEFHLNAVVRELGIGGIKLHSQVLSINRIGSIYQITQANLDSSELQLNGEIDVSKELWNLRIVTDALSAGSIFLDSSDPTYRGVPQIGQRDLSNMLFGNLGTEFVISSQLTAEGDFTNFSYTMESRLYVEQAEDVFLTADISGDEELLTIQNLYIQQSENNYASFGGTVDLLDWRLRGSLAATKFSLFSEQYVLDGRIAIRQNDRYYVVTGKNFMLNDLVVPSLTVEIDASGNLFQSNASIQFSEEQYIAVQSISENNTPVYSVTFKDIDGKTLFAILENTLPPDLQASVASMQNIAGLQESVFLVEGIFTLSKDSFNLASLDAKLQGIFSEDLITSIDLRYANDTMLIRSLDIDIFGIIISGNSTVAISQSRQSIDGEFRVGRKLYAIKGGVRDNYVTATLADVRSANYVMIFEYSSFDADTMSISLITRDFFIPVSATQIPIINCNIQFYKNANDWELSIVDFSFEDALTSLKVEFSGNLNSETGFLNETEVENEFSRFNG